MSKSRRTGRQLPWRRRFGWAMAAVTVGMVAVSACGGSTTEGADPAGKAPLPGIMEFGLNEEQYAAHIEKTQAAIARCMNAAGFEYIPVDVKTIALAQARVRKDPGYTRRTYKEKWGLAVTTRFDNPWRDTGLGPNLQIWRSLPKADQLAYSRTLFGENPDADFVFAFDEEDFSDTGGCTRKAVEQVFTPAQIKGSYVHPKDVLVESDPRVVAANKAWSDCMHKRGYEYEEDQDEIIEEYQERLDELLEGDDPRTLTGQRLEALHKLQKAEIAVSLADYECQVKHTDDVLRQVELEIFGRPVSG